MYKINESIVVFPEENKIAVSIKDPFQKSILSGLPKAESKDFGNTTMFLFPWCDDICRVLVNMGLDTALSTPFWAESHPKIEGKYDGMAHQLLTSAFIILNPRCYVLSDCRLGKTGSAILALDYLQRQHAFTGGVLVITTVTTMRSVWQSSIHETLPEDRIVIVHGKGKDKALQAQAEWFITNYDSVRLHTKAFAQAVKEKRIGCVLIDELTHVGNSSSQRHKAINDLVNGDGGIPYVIGMTGSPGCRPEPIYGMAKTINPGKLPVRTKTGWMNLTTFRYGPQPYMYKPVSNVAEIIHDTLMPAIRFKKEDVLDLPPITFQDRTCDLSKDQERMVREFRQDAVAFAKSGEVITAANSAVLLSKLLQVPLGFVLKDGEPMDISHDTRTDTIVDIVQESEHKTVIFSMFKHRLAMLEQELNKKGLDAVRIDGEVTGEKRAKILSDFAKTPSPHVLVCHPTTVGFGTELSAADTLVLDGPPLLGDFSYTQTLERLSSPKQQADKISIIRVMATPEEKSLFRRLDAGQTAGRAVAALFEDMKNAS